MAKSNATKSGAQPLAIELLMSDHRKVEELFAQYEDEKEGGEETRRALAQQICSDLKVHTQIEEELFYPWLREALDEDDVDMVEEAEVEHNGAKNLIAEIEGAETIDAAFDAKVKVLSEYIKHHVKEEENEIFPEVRDQREELDEIGQQMAARKSELMEGMGLGEGEGAPPVAKRGDGRRPHAR